MATFPVLVGFILVCVCVAVYSFCRAACAMQKAVARRNRGNRLEDEAKEPVTVELGSTVETN